MDAEEFKRTIWNYYHEHKRAFPWRENTDQYSVFISEVMLQQTQAPRVISKYNEFIRQFPDFASLASATTADVLKLWQGLGYNRRALNLQRSAQLIVSKYSGELPKDIELLDALPGIGPATACSINAFAFNEPSVFIETNVRTVFIHFFFSDREMVSDQDILPLVAFTIDKENAREWYYALMDYGTMLKKTVGNVGKKSKHYAKQSTFKGSTRELRGKLLRLLTEKRWVKVDRLKELLDDDLERITYARKALMKEGFITGDDSFIRLV